MGRWREHFQAGKKLFKLFLILFFLSSYSVADVLIIEPDAGRTPLLKAIQQSKSSIDLAMYGFTDQTFINALIQRKNQGKTIHILLEPKPYQAENENTRAIRKLLANHIDLQWPDKKFQLLHQKTLIVDNQTAIVMTLNLTNSSFAHQRNFALIVTDPNEVNEIKHVFDADFAHQNITVTEKYLFWSPDNSREKMLQFIQTAQSEINIYAQDITDYQLIGALAKMARKGISVKILVSVSPEQFQKNRKYIFLTQSGVMIHNSRHYYIHAKVLMVDHKKAVLGSINFTKSSLDDNRELSVMTEDRSVMNQLSKTFDNDW